MRGLASLRKRGCMHQRMLGMRQSHRVVSVLPGALASWYCWGPRLARGAKLFGNFEPLLTATRRWRCSCPFESLVLCESRRPLCCGVVGARITLGFALLSIKLRALAGIRTQALQSGPHRRPDHAPTIWQEVQGASGGRCSSKQEAAGIQRHAEGCRGAA